MNKKSTTVRINYDAKEILDKICEITEVPKGKIMCDSLKIFGILLENNDYNYSKIAPR